MQQGLSITKKNIYENSPWMVKNYPMEELFLLPNIIKSFPLGLRKILWVVSKIIIYGFFILLAYYGFKVLTLIRGETLVTLEWVPQIFVQSLIPIGSLLFMLSETLRLREDYVDVMSGKKRDPEAIIVEEQN